MRRRKTAWVPSVARGALHVAPLFAVLAVSAPAWAAAPNPPSAKPLIAPAGQAAPKPTGKIDDCLECHEDSGETFTLPDGSKLGIDIDRKQYAASVHGGELGCSDCHTDISDHPHPALTAKDKRDFQLQMGETCKRCHYANYTRSQDGIHFKLLAAGDRRAPTCVDCHGSHSISNPKVPRTSIDGRCGKCHADIANAYRSSVHGRALYENHDPDVPTCTDCHGAHSITDPRSPLAEARTHKKCEKCHADKEKMERHGLNPNVVDTYLDDFHGRSNKLYDMGAGVPGKPLATCTDCHGIHDIQTTRGAEAQAAIKARVKKVCATCHQGVAPEFSEAWLGHYEASFSSHPVVWTVTWIYRFMIPLIILGLILHILLHLYRIRVGR